MAKGKGSGRKSYRRRKLPKFKLKKETIYTVTSVVFFAVAALLFTALFHPTSSMLRQANELLRAYFGVLSYLLPLLIVSIAFLFLRLKVFFARPNVALGLFLVLLALAGMAQTGVAGGLLWENVSFLISGVGAWFLFAGTLVIGLSILLNTSLDEIVFFVVTILTNTYSMITGVFDRKSALNKKGGFDSKEIQVKGGNLPTLAGRSSNKQATAVAPAGNLSPLEPEGLGATTITNDPGEQQVWEYPPLSLLSEVENSKADAGDVRKNASVIEQTLESFGIKARVVEVNLGPAVAQYALEIALGTKLSKITGLANDLALALAAPTGQIRIEAPIPGRSLVGVEVPNRTLRVVTLKEMLLSV